MVIVKRILVLASLSIGGIALLAPLAAQSAMPVAPVDVPDRLLAPALPPSTVASRSLLSARSAATAPGVETTAEALEPDALPTPGSLAMEATLYLVGPPAPAPAPARRAATYTGDSVWDDLARCESGGNWSINSGNGYYGGLQFSHGTWHQYGGGEFADYPHKASRAEQIIVAERLRAARGYQPWPACRLKLGLP